jgi:hypothetical protein
MLLHQEALFMMLEVRRNVEKGSTHLFFGCLNDGGLLLGEILNEIGGTRHLDSFYYSFKEGNSIKVSPRYSLRPRNQGGKNVVLGMNGGLGLNYTS